MSESIFRSDEKLVVLVDDEPIVRDVAACELTDRGFMVVEFASADEALPWLRQHGDTPAVVITDVQMPGVLNGLQLVEILSRLWPTLAVLVTSGGSLVNPALLPPSAKFVSKPWRVSDLAARVQRMVAST